MINGPWATLSRYVLLGFSALLLATGPGCGIAFMIEEPVNLSTAFIGFRGRLVDFETGQAVGQAKVIVKKAGTSERRPYYVFSDNDGEFKLNQLVSGGEIGSFKPGDRYLLILTGNDHRLKRYPVVFEGGAQDLGLIELLPMRIGGEVLPVVQGTIETDALTREPTQLRVGPPVP